MAQAVVVEVVEVPEILKAAQHHCLLWSGLGVLLNLLVRETICGEGGDG